MKQENKYDIGFPAIDIAKKHVFGIRNEQDIVLCTRREMRKGYYRDLVILDSQCRKIMIKDAVKIGYGPLDRSWFMYGLRIKVALELSEPQILSLSEFKEVILTGMKKEQDFWESGGPFHIFCNPICKATTAAAITRYFCELYYKSYQ